MKNLIMLSGLLSLLLISFPENALAKKKYRYIKREHGLQTSFQAEIPGLINFTNMDINFNGIYRYNYAGRIEIGNYLGLGFGGGSLYKLQAGLIMEYNFIKNRGKRKIIPSAGFKVGYLRSIGNNLEAGLHGSLKYFVAKRTALVGTLEASSSLSLATFSFSSLEYQMNLLGGFAYYFDFY